MDYIMYFSQQNQSSNQEVTQSKYPRVIGIFNTKVGHNFLMTLWITFQWFVLIGVNELENLSLRARVDVFSIGRLSYIVRSRCKQNMLFPFSWVRMLFYIQVCISRYPKTLNVELRDNKKLQNEVSILFHIAISLAQLMHFVATLN